MAVSAGGVAILTAGGLLVYSGLSNATPLTALHGLLTGSPVSLDNGASAATLTAQQTATVSGAAANVAAGTNTATATSGSSIVAGAMQFKDDIYSQARRNQQGYSDCSSFVSKALLAAGITPCNWKGGNYPTTVSYHLWSGLKGIPLSEAQAGDILLSGGHIAIVTGPGTAIGQENPRVNVREGSFASIMALTGTYGAYRVVG